MHKNYKLQEMVNRFDQPGSRQRLLINVDKMKTIIPYHGRRQTLIKEDECSRDVVEKHK